MQPFLEARFTPGIVDGSERGSSKGLGPLLNELLVYVKEVYMFFRYAGIDDTTRLAGGCRLWCNETTEDKERGGARKCRCVVIGVVGVDRVYNTLVISCVRVCFC